LELAVLVGDSGDYLAGFIVEDGGALKLCKSMIVILEFDRVGDEGLT
jgi:hypothetical protein